MRSVYLAGAFMLTLVLALPAQAQKKPGQKQKPGQTLEADKVLKPGDVAGRLAAVSGNLFTLRVDYNSLELAPNARNIINSANRQNQNLARQFNRLAQLQNQLGSARSARQYQSIMRQINSVVGQLQRTAGRGQQSPYRVVRKSANIEIEMSPDVKIRTNFLPFAYDDMGEPKKYSKEEIKELKGPNSKEPGYKAELTDLKVGQDIKVTLARVKEKDSDSPALETKDKATDSKTPAAKDTKTKVKTRLMATRILILKESNQPVSPGNPRRKKKQ